MKQPVRSTTLQLSDIWEASYVEMHGEGVNLVNHGGRIIFEIPASEAVYDLLNEFRSNPDIQLYVRTTKKLKGRMMDMKREGIDDDRQNNR